jgi:hypothetical protein
LATIAAEASPGNAMAGAIAMAALIIGWRREQRFMMMILSCAHAGAARVSRGSDGVWVAHDVTRWKTNEKARGGAWKVRVHRRRLVCVLRGNAGNVVAPAALGVAQRPGQRAAANSIRRALIPLASSTASLPDRSSAPCLPACVDQSPESTQICRSFHRERRHPQMPAAPGQTGVTQHDYMIDQCRCPARYYTGVSSDTASGRTDRHLQVFTDERG